MTETILRHPKFYSIQNGLAAMLFGTIAAAEILRHLLSIFPGTELLWRLTSLSNSTVAPLLNALGKTIHSPLALLAVLLLAFLVPLAAWRKRHWLGTAMSGHVALACLVVLTWWALKRNNVGVAMASLSDAFEPRLFDTSSVGFLVLSVIMAGMCILNHVAFFRSAAR